MIEEIIEKTPAAKKYTRPRVGAPSTPHRLTEISSDAEERIALPIEEFSRVLGGGIVPGSVVLIGGDPGIGKSTLLLQTTLELSHAGTVLYVSGEESERQIKMRAMRIFNDEDGEKLPLPENLFLVTETSLELIFEHIEMTQPYLVVIDSIQSTYLSQLESSAGSISTRAIADEPKGTSSGKNMIVTCISLSKLNTVEAVCSWNSLVRLLSSTM